MCAPQRSPSCQPAAGGYRSRQPGHFLESASLHPPQAALRRFPRRPLQKHHPIGWCFFRVRLSARRRVSRLPAATAADSRDTSSKAPRFIRRRRRFGAFLVARSKKERHPHGCLSFLEQHFCYAKVVACGRYLTALSARYGRSACPTCGSTTCATHMPSTASALVLTSRQCNPTSATLPPLLPLMSMAISLMTCGRPAPSVWNSSSPVCWGFKGQNKGQARFEAAKNP